MSEGHLFIVNGDITRLACHAWLLPTDPDFSITPAFDNAYRQLGAATWRPGDWPGNGCIRAAEGGGRDPDVWLVDIGRTDRASFEHFASRAVNFVEVACRIARKRLEGRRPLVALPVVGSGDGGKRSERGTLLGALIPALHAAATEHGDVVLVTHGEVMYSAAQTVRSQVLSPETDFWPELAPDLKFHARELASVAQAGKLVAFLGAGVSLDAGLPLWKPMLEAIARSVEVEELDDTFWKLDPRDQATVLHNAAPERFRSAVAEALAGERYSLAHGLLASMPISEAVTTNFDDLFELAAASAGRPLSVIPGGDVRQAARWLLKLHGTLGKDVVLTRSDYLGAASLHGALRGLVQALLMTRTMLFIGYGLADEDFHQLVHDVRVASGNDNRNLGIALSIDTPPYFDLLWRDLSVLSFDDGSNTIEEAARAQLIFLDMVAFHSMTSLRFAADDSFASLRSRDEATLAGKVAELAELAESYNRTDPGWSDVHAFIDRFRVDSD